ncbi:Thymidylate kinase [Actinokineospora spheciospongiae]|uniref:Thymidylate kinase n=1 Tax=Actinokineospora spheciospongiae TaxID=909613 RepID=W7JCU8_9PSEU|nr:dTMP kinase [Actinokineospora spheciospongiae]EWC63829.1 Thymidylate kinase [Actinokineospora spheciospongiae]
MTGMLVSIDGPAGAGKTTVIDLVGHHLRALGHLVHTTTEPSRGPIGQLARSHADVLHGYALASLVAADRYHHLDAELRPRRDSGHIVLCDRYLPSTLVLQRIDGVRLDFLEAVNAHVDLPDLAVLLTVAPRVAATRVHARGGAHSRFHQGPSSTAQEIVCYEQTATWLTDRRVPVLRVDTTTSSPNEVATTITEGIVAMLSTERANPHPR